MRENGYDLTGHASKVLGDLNGQQVDVAMTIGMRRRMPLGAGQAACGLEIPDPREMMPDDFRAVRNLVGTKVKQLIESM